MNIHAARIFQHGDAPEDAWKAHQLALQSANMGHRPARWMAAAAYDRWLMYQGKPQKYGTQYTTDGKRQRLWDVDTATSDQERAEWDVPPLAEQILKAEQATRSHPPTPVGEDAPQWLKDALRRWENGRTNMAKVILGTTMSLDGFINDRSGSVAALYSDLDTLRDTEPLQESIQNTGALVMGRNSFAMAEDPDSIAENYEYQVPIFVLTHHAPKQKPRETEQVSFTFVTDGIESAVAQAKAAAGDKDVTIIGAASTARQCLKAGLADELHVDIMPVLLGSGLRFFEDMEMESIRLERMKVVELPGGRTNLQFRIVK